MLNTNQHFSSNRQQGFSLIEVMVAMLIFSVGLLGLSGLQLQGLQSNHGGMMRTIATQHLYDMADRIRSSRGGFITNAGGAQACSSTICSALVTSDFDTWATTVRNTLPSGAGQVLSVAGTDAVRIIVRWDENRTGVTGTACPPGPNDLQCLSITIIP